MAQEPSPATASCQLGSPFRNCSTHWPVGAPVRRHRSADVARISLPSVRDDHLPGWCAGRRRRRAAAGRRRPSRAHSVLGRSSWRPVAGGGWRGCRVTRGVGAVRDGAGGRLQPAVAADAPPQLPSPAARRSAVRTGPAAADLSSSGPADHSRPPAGPQPSAGRPPRSP